MGGGEKIQKLIFALLGGCSQLASTLHRKCVAFGLVSSLKFTIVDPSANTTSAHRLFIEVGEERCLLGRVVQTFRFSFFMQVSCFLKIGWQVEAQGGISSVVRVGSFGEEVEWQFVFIYLDEVDPALRLAEPFPAARTLRILTLCLQSAYHSIFPPSGLLVLHSIQLFYSSKNDILSINSIVDARVDQHC